MKSEVPSMLKQWSKKLRTSLLYRCPGIILPLMHHLLHFHPSVFLTALCVVQWIKEQASVNLKTSKTYFRQSKNHAWISSPGQG